MATVERDSRRRVFRVSTETHAVCWRFTLRRSWRIRSTPALATTSAPPAAAISRVAASGARPSHHKKATSTLCVFCRMKTANSSNNSDSTMTAIQVPLVRDPRRGSCPFAGSSTPPAAESLFGVASLASGSEGWSVLTVAPWSRAARTRSTQIVLPRSHPCRDNETPHQRDLALLAVGRQAGWGEDTASPNPRRLIASTLTPTRGPPPTHRPSAPASRSSTPHRRNSRTPLRGT